MSRSARCLPITSSIRNFDVHGSTKPASAIDDHEREPERPATLDARRSALAPPSRRAFCHTWPSRKCTRARVPVSRPFKRPCAGDVPSTIVRHATKARRPRARCVTRSLLKALEARPAHRRRWPVSFAPSGSRRSATSTGRPSRGSAPGTSSGSCWRFSIARSSLNLNAVVFQVRPGADALLRVAVRAVVAVSDRAAGTRARAAVGSARVRRRAGAQARARAARVVQSVPRGVHARLAHRRATHISRTNPGLVRTVRIGSCGWIRATPRSAAASVRAIVDVVQPLRRRRRAHRRLLLSVSGERRVGQEDRFPGRGDLRAVREGRRQARRRTTGAATTSTSSSKRSTRACTRRSRG